MVRRFLSLPLFRACDNKSFPDTAQLHDVVANDCRLVRLAPGEPIYDRGSFGNAIFVVVDGWLSDARGNDHPQFDVVGEVETLRRCARASAMTAGVDGALVLELRWAGLRDLLHWSDAFRTQFMQFYATRALKAGLHEMCGALGCQAADFAPVAQAARLVRFGDFDWSHRFQRASRSRGRATHAPGDGDVLVAEGAYLDEFFFVCSGFLQSSCRKGAGALNVGCLGAGDFYGLSEIQDGLRRGTQARAEATLAAMGYADVIAVPAAVVRKSLSGDSVASGHDEHSGISDRAGHLSDFQSTRDFLIDGFLVNGRQAMLIDLSRCVHCDECLRACAATHEGVARFEHTGKTHDGVLVANACMHCTDAVCLVDCPTGAIRRSGSFGSVVVDEAACIGCGACAAGCPYDNIRMLPAHNASGAAIIDETGAKVLKAVKCDLCEDRAGGPACQEACASGALSRVSLKDVCADPYLWSFET